MTSAGAHTRKRNPPRKILHIFPFYPAGSTRPGVLLSLLASRPHRDQSSPPAVSLSLSPERDQTRRRHRRRRGAMDASYRRAGAGSGSAPRSVDDIYKDYRARRSAILRALTHGTPLAPRAAPAASRHACEGSSSNPSPSHLASQTSRSSTRCAIQVSLLPSPRDLSATPRRGLRFDLIWVRPAADAGWLLLVSSV